MQITNQMKELQFIVTSKKKVTVMTLLYLKQNLPTYQTILQCLWRWTEATRIEFKLGNGPAEHWTGHTVTIWTHNFEILWNRTRP